MGGANSLTAIAHHGSRLVTSLGIIECDRYDAQRCSSLILDGGSQSHLTTHLGLADVTLDASHNGIRSLTSWTMSIRTVVVEHTQLRLYKTSRLCIADRALARSHIDGCCQHVGAVAIDDVIVVST